jgi:gliding motility-associated protein GldC
VAKIVVFADLTTCKPKHLSTLNIFAQNLNMDSNTGRDTEIKFSIHLDEDNLPESISWSAKDGAVTAPKECQSIAIAIWDKAEKNTLRIDLWTKDMPVDEMHTHFLQNLMTLTDSYFRATNNPDIKEDMLAFCKNQAEKIKKAFEVQGE